MAAFSEPNIDPSQDEDKTLWDRKVTLVGKGSSCRDKGGGGGGGGEYFAMKLRRGRCEIRWLVR